MLNWWVCYPWNIIGRNKGEGDTHFKWVPIPARVQLDALGICMALCCLSLIFLCCFHWSCPFYFCIPLLNFAAEYALCSSLDALWKVKFSAIEYQSLYYVNTKPTPRLQHTVFNIIFLIYMYTQYIYLFVHVKDHTLRMT